ncbi:MAG: DUF523 domain-containing protein [Deltaproteobacteria bacterium]|nr:DUF523 domain-containing protein [Deltaproteobacteria bacterium]
MTGRSPRFRRRRRGRAPIRILVSACLLGERVRYDGGHKRNAFLTETVGRLVEWVPVCPEAECGLGVPREAMRLEGDPRCPRLVTVRSRMDRTEKLERWAWRKVCSLATEDFSGYVCKKNSPSCSMERVPVFDSTGGQMGEGAGIFTRIFMERFPRIPVEEEGRLADRELQTAFFERLFMTRRLRAPAA